MYVLKIKLSLTYVGRVVLHSENGRRLVDPLQGPIAEERKKCKRNVASHINKCRARQIHKQIQHRDKCIQQNQPNRFKSFKKTSVECTRLLSESGNSILTDTQELLECWADHFQSLGKSQSDSNHQLQNGDKSVNEFLTLSYDKEDNVLDCELTADEIEYAIRQLKRGRAGGADNVSPEHLKFSGPIFRN